MIWTMYLREQIQRLIRSLEQRTGSHSAQVSQQTDDLQELKRALWTLML
jgi:hypothetical protein